MRSFGLIEGRADSLANNANKTFSLPKPEDRDINRLHKLANDALSSSFKGAEGPWLNRQDLNDHSHLTGAMLPFEVYAHGLVQNTHKIFVSWPPSACYIISNED